MAYKEETEALGRMFDEDRKVRQAQDEQKRDQDGKFGSGGGAKRPGGSTFQRPVFQKKAAKPGDREKREKQGEANRREIQKGYTK